MRDERLGLRLCHPSENLVRDEEFVSSNPRQLKWGRARIGTLGKEIYSDTPNHLALSVTTGQREYRDAYTFFEQGYEVVHVGFAARAEFLGHMVVVSLTHALSGIDFRSLILLNDQLVNKQGDPIAAGWVDAWREYPDYCFAAVPFMIFDRPTAQNLSRYRAHFWPIEKP